MTMPAGPAALSLPWKRLFAEFAVIVGGVLIALAVDSWWESYQERQRETAYLQQMLLDLRETERRLVEAATGDEKMMEWAEWVLGRAFRGPLPGPDSLELPTGYNQFRPLTGTLTALVQGGDLRLLRNDSLRFELTAYAALVDATETILRHTETLIWNSTERVMFGRARHSQFAELRRTNGGRGWGKVDVVGVLNDPDVISALQVQSSASGNRLRNLDRLKEPTAALIRRIEAELGGR